MIDGDLYVVGAGDPLLATTGYLSTFDEPDEPYNDFAKLADAIKEARHHRDPRQRDRRRVEVRRRPLPADVAEALHHRQRGRARSAR